MSRVDLRNRAPTIDRLPDSRIRISRTYDVINFAIFTPVELAAEVWLPWGTPDTKYPVALLVKQDVKGQHPAGSGMRADPTISPEKHPPLLERIFEQIDPSLETAVGNADVNIGADGLITVKQDYLQFSTGTAIYGVPGVTPCPPPWDTQCVLKDDERTDDGTLRRIKRVFISQGLIKQKFEYRNNGELVIQTLTYVNQIPPTPSGFTLIDSNVENPGFLPVFTYTFAKGYGVIDIRIQAREGGLRLQTYISLGTAYNAGIMQPTGILMANDQEWVEGMYKYTTTCMQSAAGGNPLIGTAIAYWDKHPFRYPGRAKAFAKSFPAVYGSNSSGKGTFTATAYDVFMSPPVDVELDSLVSITYGTANYLTLGTSFWNPDNWAVMQAVYQRSQTITPVSQIKALNGYRAINSGTALPFTAGSTIISFGAGTVDVTANVTSCLGDPIYQLSSGSLVVTGGPAAPDGQTWILSAKLEPAFQDFYGTKYFRQTVVAATIPTQTALPV